MISNTPLDAQTDEVMQRLAATLQLPLDLAREQGPTVLVTDLMEEMKAQASEMHTQVRNEVKALLSAQEKATKDGDQMA